MLPNFLGIGFPRSGTTWLHELLSEHPDVYLPTQRKEIHFFDKHYAKGLEWYEKFFPSEEEAAAYSVVGEISPEYIFEPEYLDQISAMGSVKRFVLMLRNPVDRAYSHYGMLVRNQRYSKSFEVFLEESSRAKYRGYYSEHLKEFYKRFDRDTLLVLITEQAVKDVAGTKRALADFLEIPFESFPESAGMARVNSGYVPRAPRLYAVVTNIGRKLRKWDWLIDLVKKLGVKRMFMTNKSLPPMQRETRRYLEDLYADEIDTLEAMISRNLDVWRPKNRSGAPDVARTDLTSSA